MNKTVALVILLCIICGVQSYAETAVIKPTPPNFLVSTLIALVLLLIWVLQALIASIINYARPTRLPKNAIDFMKLTFAPYVIYCIFFNDEALD